MRKFSIVLILGFLLVSLNSCSSKKLTVDKATHATTSQKMKNTKKYNGIANKEAGVALSHEELAAAVYLENYMNQHTGESITVAAKNILKQSKFMITKKDNGVFIVNQEPTLTKGLVASEVVVKNNDIHTTDFNGNQKLREKNYKFERLAKKYGPYAEQLKKIVQLSRQNKQSRNNLTNEEIALAAYVNNYMRDYKISAATEFEDISKSPYFEFKGAENSFSISQGTGDSTEKISIVDGHVVCVIHVSAYDTHKEKFSVTSINTEFKQYKNQLEQLIYRGRQEERSTSSSQVDTKNLTTDQAIKWVKNYLSQQGATTQEIDEAGFKTQMDEDGCLEILVYTWVSAHTFKKLAYIYRINSDGILQEGNINNSDEWNTVSSNYIE